MTIYRDSRGRFSTERGAAFKQVGGQHFVRLFGRWAEMKPVTQEAFLARMKSLAAIQSAAAAA